MFEGTSKVIYLIRQQNIKFHRIRNEKQAQSNVVIISGHAQVRFQALESGLLATNY